MQELARTIALRRTPMEDAEARIAGFAETHDARGADRARWSRRSTTSTTRRNRVMAGITSYAHKQEALDVRIDDTRHALAAATAAEPQDFDRIDALEEELDWSTRIFQDRQQSLTYVCETPVILEQRAFALGAVDRGAAAAIGRTPCGTKPLKEKPFAFRRAGD